VRNYPLDKISTPWYIAAHFSAGHDGSGYILSQPFARAARSPRFILLLSSLFHAMRSVCGLMRSLCLCV